MKNYIVGVIIFVVFVCCGVSANAACNISNYTVVIGSITDGIRVVRSCTISFENIDDIDIGSSEGACAGIEIDPGVTLTIDVASFGNVRVYGGYYFKEGNEYDCAGIYVPTTSTLVIDSRGRGKLEVYPFDRGAGIGGNGILLTSFNGSVDCQDAGKILMKSGKVVVHDPVEYSGFAKGAGIGGGGICNVNDEVKFLYGGVLKMFRIIDGEITVMSNSIGSSYGEGAGIGGGSICNFNEYVNTVQGGDAREIIIDGGRINIHKEVYKDHKGLGAGIGGGGIYNKSNADILSKGQLVQLSDSGIAKIYCDNCSEVYGDGTIYSNGSTIETCMQKKEETKYVDSAKSKVAARVVGLGVMFSALFMLFELMM